MFKAPEHQVAGHRASDGQLGPLVDGSGNFYKPLQTNERGNRELAFYSSFSSNERVPDRIRRYFPLFHGTKLVESSDGSGPLPHLVLEDLVSSFSRPCIMDIKIGSRTWYPEASDEYIQRSLKKDKETSSLLLGFRISGLQIYGDGVPDLWKSERKLVQTLTSSGVRLTLKKFVSKNIKSDLETEEPDCSFASSVYGGSTGILAQLLELKSWFEDQTIYHFNSCSVLMLYDKGLLSKETSAAKVKLIDFAHVTESNGIIDHNFLGGLCSLIKFISEILTSPCRDERCETMD